MRKGSGAGVKNLSRAASPHLIAVRRVVVSANGHQYGCLWTVSPGARYSKGSIIFWKTSFFRVPSILWATLPALSMITVVGTTEMLP
jgi:hypothetical protein